MKQVVYFFLFALLSSCVKQESDIPNQDSKANYQPTKAGFIWNYRVTGTSNYIYTQKAEARDSVINNIPYRVFSNNKDPHEYHYKDGGNYYRYSFPPEFNYQPVSVLFLRDYLSAGEEWLEVESVAIGGLLNVDAEMTIKIAEKDISYTVNGINYQKVIHLVLTPVFKTLFITIPSTSDIHYYYADNIGLIYNKTTLQVPSANVNIDKEVKLVSYSTP